MVWQCVGDVLRLKSKRVYSVGPLATVIEAVRLMADRHVGSVVVLEGGYPIGILSEREVLVGVVAAGKDPSRSLVRDVMTTRLNFAAPDDSIADVITLMTESRCRHVPIMDGDRLVGLLSVGDLAKAVRRELPEAEQGANRVSGFYGT